MPQFVVYSKTGQILRSGYCQDSDVHLQPRNGEELAAVGAGSDDTHYVKNGQILKLPERPSRFHEFDYSAEQWVDRKSQQQKNDEILEGVRIERDGLIRATDWTQMPDAPLTEQQRTAWAIYRQSLRDVPQNNANVASLDEVQWPSKPEA